MFGNPPSFYNQRLAFSFTVKKMHTNSLSIKMNETTDRLRPM